MTRPSISAEEIPAREALEAWDAWLSTFSSERNTEIYGSADGRAQVKLSLESEPAFGPPLLKASLLEPVRTALKGSFLSPGRFGKGFSQFGGNPFSPDSGKLALVAVKPQREPLYQGCVFDTRTGRMISSYKSNGPLLHHSWSPGSGLWLAQRYGAWILWDSTSGETRELHEGSRFFPNHASFCGRELLVFSEDRKTASLLDLPAGHEIVSRQLPSVQGPFFSFPLREGGLALATGARYGAELHAERWIRIQVMPDREVL